MDIATKKKKKEVSTMDLFEEPTLSKHEKIAQYFCKYQQQENYISCRTFLYEKILKKKLQYY